MRTIIHDLDNIDFLNVKSDDNVINNVDNNSCVGCFKCWVKEPLKCTFKDKISENGKNILNSDELIIISKCIDGSYSYKVKRILERSISYVEPFFVMRDNEIHHKTRTDKKINFKVYFYNNYINEMTKETASKLVKANQKNLNTNEPEIYFVSDLKEIKI